MDVTPKTLAATVKSLTGPAELRLAPGDYSKVRMAPARPVVITSADPENRARFVDGLTLDKPSSLSFVGVDFDISSATAEFADAVRINGGSGIEFSGCGFSGAEHEDGERWGRGINAMGVRGLVVRGSVFRHLHRGVVAGSSEQVEITDNDFFDLGTDGVNLGQVTGARVLRNLFKGFKPSGGDHPDGVQVMTGPGLASADVEIADNCVACGDAGVQGIFVRAENTAVRHRDIRVLRNALLGAGLNAISVGSTDDAQITGNTCLFVPRLPKAKQSNIRAENTNGVAEGNKAMGFSLAAGIKQDDNMVIGAATQEQLAEAEAAWMAQFRAPPVEPTPEPEVIEITLKPGQRLVVTGAA